MTAPINTVRGEGHCGRATNRGEEACKCLRKYRGLISSPVAFSPAPRGYVQKRHTRPAGPGE